MRLDTIQFWRERVHVLTNEMIDRKVKQSGCTRDKARAAFRDWIKRTTGIVIRIEDNLSVEQCKTIVAQIHRFR